MPKTFWKGAEPIRAKGICNAKRCLWRSRSFDTKFLKFCQRNGMPKSLSCEQFFYTKNAIRVSGTLMKYISEDIKFIKMLIPTSGAIPARENARYVLEMAKKLRAEVIVLHVRDKGESREGDLALDFFDKVSKELGITVRLLPALGPVARTIIETAKFEDVSLIVMGATKGRMVAKWIIDEIIRSTDIPVVIIPWKYDENLYKEVISA